MATANVSLGDLRTWTHHVFQSCHASMISAWTFHMSSSPFSFKLCPIHHGETSHQLTQALRAIELQSRNFLTKLVWRTSLAHAQHSCLWTPFTDEHHNQAFSTLCPYGLHYQHKLVSTASFHWFRCSPSCLKMDENLPTISRDKWGLLSVNAPDSCSGCTPFESQPTITNWSYNYFRQTCHYRCCKYVP